MSASGIGEGGFSLENEAGGGVAYRLFLHRGNANGQGPREELRAGRPSRHTITGDGTFRCGGGSNARVRVRIGRRDIERAPPGIYRDTLLLTLSAL